MKSIRIFLGGDCMLGRGVDACCRESCHPRLFEQHCSSALDYIRLAETHAGQIPRPCDPDYFWGSGLEVLQQSGAHVRIVNLETSVTTISDSPSPGRSIHYHMHPSNLDILKAADIDAVSVANNHTSDFGPSGLLDTVRALGAAEIQHAGAGVNSGEAERCCIIPLVTSPEAPAVSVPASEGRASDDNDMDDSNIPNDNNESNESRLTTPPRILLYATSHESSGVPPQWRASPLFPGVHMTNMSSQSVHDLAQRIARDRQQPNDVVILSIHWGPNWGYEIEKSFTEYAHSVIEAGVDIVFGHSSHHPQAIEIHRERLIIYGTGDLINDYEGIVDTSAVVNAKLTTPMRSDLSLLYFVDVDALTGKFLKLHLVPQKIQKFSLTEPSEGEVNWLYDVLCAQYASRGAELKRGEVQIGGMQTFEVEL